QTPGRMNLFNLGQFHAMVDYAHNPHSYEALGSFIRNWPGERIGVVGGPGDRRDEDFVTLGQLSATIFDRIIVKEDNDNRGRTRGDAARLILEGIAAANQGVPHETILDETVAVNTALDLAPAGSLVVIFPESVSRAIDLINARHPQTDLDLPSTVQTQTLPAENSSSNGTSTTPGEYVQSSS
ncbi:MAG TPA: cyanophycin synthetase, partial [Coleofasciculaceae cyanobacterium]